MGYPIIFKTKIIQLSDGRLLHLALSGCNNDTEGRHDDDWSGTIYTQEAFVKKAESFKTGSKPAKEFEGFDLKIGRRFCTYYDYGEHLLRMMKRAIPFNQMLQEYKYVSFQIIDGAIVYENGDIKEMSMEEFHTYTCKKMYEGGCRYKMLYTRLKSENDIIKAIENRKPMRICIIV